MERSLTVDGLYVAAVAPDTPQSHRPPLLLVHGGCHGAWCWEPWLQALPGLGWEGYALSLRNHPGSVAVDAATFLTGLTVEDYADDVATVAAHIGRPSVVVGHSLGGIVAQCYAARRGPTPRPAALVLLASVPPGGLGAIRSAPFPTDVPMLPDAETAARLFFHSTPAPAVAAAVARLVGESPAVINSYSLEPGFPIPRDAVTCPVLSVTAGYDGTPCPRDGRIADYYGGTHWHEPEMGHNLMCEVGADDLLRRMLGWLERNAA